MSSPAGPDPHPLPSHFAAIRRSRTTQVTTLKLASYSHSFSNNAAVFGTLGEPADARGAFAVGAVAQYVWPQAQIESYSSRGPTTDGRNSSGAKASPRRPSGPEMSQVHSVMAGASVLSS